MWASDMQNTAFIKTSSSTIVLVYDVGSTYTKAAALMLNSTGIGLLGQAKVPTNVADIETSINAIEEAFSDILTGRPAPEVYASSSAAGGLRMAAIGFMPDVTVKAAKEVAMTAGARVLEVLSYLQHPVLKIEILREISPDIILLAGGTNGGDTQSIIEDAKIIVRSRTKAMVVIAGNETAQYEVGEILRMGGITSTRVPNIMPTIHELHVGPARKVIHNRFISQITKVESLGRLVSKVTNGLVVPTPGAVLMGAEMLSMGTFEGDGIGDLVVVDIGGATTDIHSVLPSKKQRPIEEVGLIFNNEQEVSYRTVEGNLGLRINAAGIVETVGPKAVLAKVGLQGGDAIKGLTEYVELLERSNDHIAQSDTEQVYDEALAIVAAEVALKRHAGYLSSVYDPVTGCAPGTPVGRHLRKVRYIVGVGGIFNHSSQERRQQILRGALENPGITLIPRDAKILIDDKYLLYAVGILGQVYPNHAHELACSFISKGG